MKHLLKSPNIYTETHCGRDVTTTNVQIGDVHEVGCTLCLVREAARLEAQALLIAKRLTELQTRT